MKVAIAGYGAGTKQSCLPATQQALDVAGLVLGAPRLLKSAGIDAPRGIAAINAEEIAAAINTASVDSACVLMSGDSGFYSGTKRLLPLLDDHEVTVLPGISSVQALSSALQLPWQSWRLCSAHGVDCNAAHEVSRHAECFFLTGGMQTPDVLCRALAESGFGALNAFIGSDLGGEEQQIISATVEELARRQFSSLSVLLVQNPAPRRQVGFGLPDTAFTRGDIPMTKSEVRAVALSKLRLCGGDIVYDIGSGTGSVAVEAALMLDSGRVYAIEQKPEGCRLTAENAKQLGAFNLTCIEGAAPEALQTLPVPDVAFIGGSSGRLRKIIALLREKNPQVRLVVTAVTLETIAEAVELFNELNLPNSEVVQVAVSRAEPLGRYHILAAQNPVYIISGGGRNA
ncbi:precorrin-6y C5,15-methyltransferase (decarboxylating) subunit CbiE [Oscillospiraceae bacterium LTW-04]|nr:precorrin-6y C5,15-methyltransferase (decarboxylating) subunit CbiE [Oscillospiraceae bacterium MB24-C1]